MAKKATKTKPGTFRSILFYADDDDRVERIRERLRRRDPTRNVKVTDVIRYALAVADGQQK